MRSVPKWSVEEIAYCANVHPGNCSAEIENNLRTITSQVRKASGLRKMYAGLWLCESAIDEYQSPAKLRNLIETLENENLSVVTLNGFPQGDFHQDIVKKSVYLPTWAQESRCSYTLALAEMLAKCLPADVKNGTISTLPLAYRHGWDSEQEKHACYNLFKFALGAQKIEKNTGKRIRLCMEMEPGCVLENTQQIIYFFSTILREFAQQNQYSLSLINHYLGICFDVCHQAVMQENIAESVKAINQAGIVIGKVQVSSAMKVKIDEKATIFKPLLEFAEPKYMHQVTSRGSDGQFIFFDDLCDFIDAGDVSVDTTLWVHYHLPIQAKEVLVAGGLPLKHFSTTRDQIEEFFDTIGELQYAPHIEVETYTWHVLPGFNVDNMPQCLIDGLVNERLWLVEQMQKRHLLKFDEISL